MRLSVSRKTRTIALRAIGVCFLLAALYHVAAIMRPDLVERGSPARHGLFVVINVVFAVALFRRPRVLFWFFLPLGLQQLHSHGRALVHDLVHLHRLDWPSLLVLLVAPYVTWLLWLDWREPRALRGASNEGQHQQSQ
jgi:hypothetical protein